MARGYVALVLHAHLPFVRHPEDPTVMEGRWFYEAITGTYLPLLQTLERLRHDGVPARLTLSLSAPLLTMLTDDLLRERYAAHLEQMLELAEKEIVRTRPEPHYHRLALLYAERFHALRETWRSHDGALVQAFGRLQRAGLIELITSTATHAFFPALDRNDAAVRAQIQVAADLYAAHFGRPPRGMWLGECGYVPGVDAALRAAGIRYFFVDGHALALADHAATYGVYAPVFCPSGVAAFARDPESSEQVWSATQGYPGDRQYRDFYRDIGFDLPLEYIGPYVHPDGHRLATGFKYHAITHDHLHDKWVYDPELASAKVGLHAAHFRERRQRQVDALAAQMDRPPLVVSPYDAELFGHWWYEGPQFLDGLFRQLHHDQQDLEPITPGDYLDRHPTNQATTPSASSWGAGGYNAYWISEQNAWIYPHLHVAGERMVELAHRFPSADGRLADALNQAARELLLAQSSDWPFIMRTGTTVPYATRRVTQHLARFTRLYDEICADRVSDAWLEAVRATDNIFPDLDYRVFADAGGRTP